MKTDVPVVAERSIRADRLFARLHAFQNAYGLVYEIEGPIKAPNGKTVRFCSIWQVDTGTDVPRFITMYPR